MVSAENRCENCQVRNLARSVIANAESFSESAQELILDLMEEEDHLSSCSELLNQLSISNSRLTAVILGRQRQRQEAKAWVETTLDKSDDTEKVARDFEALAEDHCPGWGRGGSLLGRLLISKICGMPIAEKNKFLNTLEAATAAEDGSA